MDEIGPATLPDARLGSIGRFPWVTLSLAAVAVVGGTLAVTPWLDLGPAGVPAVFGFLFLLLLAGPALEYALGPAVHLLVLLMAAMIGVLTPLGAGQAPDAVAWLPFAGASLVGLNLGLFPGWSTRPLYFVPGPVGRLTLPWGVLLGVWFGHEAVVWWLGGAGAPALSPPICFVAGLGIGLALHALTHSRPSVMSPGYAEQVVESGAAEVEALIRQHKVARACRVIDRLVRVAPLDRDLRRLRYAVWKYRPTHDAFHEAARDLLDRPGNDRDSNAFVESMYQDYLAVSQGQPRLPVDFHLGLAERFARNEKVEDAAVIVNVHLQRTPKHPALPSALLTLAHGYLETDRPSRAAFYADTLVHLFPESPEAPGARALLARVAPDA